MTDESTYEAYADCMATIKRAYNHWLKEEYKAKPCTWNDITISFHQQAPGDPDIPSFYKITLQGGTFAGRFPPDFKRYYREWGRETETVDLDEVARMMMLLAGFDDVLSKDLQED